MKIIITILLSIFSLGCGENSMLSPNKTSQKMDPTQNRSDRILGNSQNIINSSYEIRPGFAVGKILLGKSYEEVAPILGKAFFDNTYSNGCKRRNVKWLVKLSDESYSILDVTFSKENRATVLSVDGDVFKTPEGITTEISLTDFKEVYSDLEDLSLFADRGFKLNSKSVDGYSAFFVNSKHGIAFEFYKDKSEKQWKVKSINVFNPTDGYFSRGRCSIPSEHWVQIFSFDLESVTELVESHDNNH